MLENSVTAPDEPRISWFASATASRIAPWVALVSDATVPRRLETSLGMISMAIRPVQVTHRDPPLESVPHQLPQSRKPAQLDRLWFARRPPGRARDGTIDPRSGETRPRPRP